MPTDEDESEPESEEEFELSEKEQRLLHEAYDTYATTGQQWLRRDTRVETARPSTSTHHLMSTLYQRCLACICRRSR